MFVVITLVQNKPRSPSQKSPSQKPPLTEISTTEISTTAISTTEPNIETSTIHPSITPITLGNYDRSCHALLPTRHPIISTSRIWRTLMMCSALISPHHDYLRVMWTLLLLMVRRNITVIRHGTATLGNLCPGIQIHTYSTADTLEADLQQTTILSLV